MKRQSRHGRPNVGSILQDTVVKKQMQSNWCRSIPGFRRTARSRRGRHTYVGNHASSSRSSWPRKFCVPQKHRGSHLLASAHTPTSLFVWLWRRNASTVRLHTYTLARQLLWFLDGRPRAYPLLSLYR